MIERQPVIDEHDGFLVGFRGWHIGANHRLLAASMKHDDYWSPENQGKRATCAGSPYCKGAKVDPASPYRRSWAGSGVRKDAYPNVRVDWDEESIVLSTYLRERYTVRCSRYLLENARELFGVCDWLQRESFSVHQATPSLVRYVFEDFFKALEAEVEALRYQEPEEAIVPSEADDNCGVHAWYDINGSVGTVHGAILAWGKIIEHPPQGFRCQHAKVLAFSTPLPSTYMGKPVRSEQLEILSRIYRVPIVKHENIMRWALEFGDVKPGGNLQSKEFPQTVTGIWM